MLELGYEMSYQGPTAPSITSVTLNGQDACSGSPVQSINNTLSESVSSVSYLSNNNCTTINNNTSLNNNRSCSNNNTEHSINNSGSINNNSQLHSVQQ